MCWFNNLKQKVVIHRLRDKTMCHHGSPSSLYLRWASGVDDQQGVCGAFKNRHRSKPENIGYIFISPSLHLKLLTMNVCKCAYVFIGRDVDCHIYAPFQSVIPLPSVFLLSSFDLYMVCFASLTRTPSTCFHD